MPENEQTPSFEGGSEVEVKTPDTSFSGDVKLIESLQQSLPKYKGTNPYHLKQRLIQDDEFYNQFTNEFLQVTDTPELQQLRREDPETYEALNTNFRKNFRKQLTSSAYAGETEKDTLVNRTLSFRGDVDSIPSDTYKSIVQSNPEKYERFGLVRDGQLIYGDENEDTIAFSQTVLSNPDLHKSLVLDRYKEFQQTLTKSHNNPALVDDQTKKTQAWVIYDNFGSEGLTQYINGLQSDDTETDILTRTQAQQQVGQFFREATINGKTAFDLIEEYVTGGDEPLSFQPVTPRDDLTKNFPSDINAFTSEYYQLSEDGNSLENKDPYQVSEGFLKKFSPDNYQKFLDPKNLQRDGEFSNEYRQLTWNVYEWAHESDNIDALMDTVRESGEHRTEGGRPVYRVNYNSANPKVRTAIDALRHDDEGGYMFQKVADGIYDFKPKRREQAQANFDWIKEKVFATKSELYEDENGELQRREVTDNSGIWGIWNSIATVGLGVADMANRYFYEPAVRTIGELTGHEGTQAYASELKNWTGVDLSSGLSRETDGFVPNAIGEVAPFVQYMGAMMVGGSALIRGGAKAFSAVTGAKKALDAQRYAGHMVGSNRWQAMAQKLNHAVKNKTPWAAGSLSKRSPWVTGAGVFYTGGAAIEATQPKEMSFFNTMPQFLGYEPTNELTKLYKTSSDAQRVAMNIGASLVMDGFFDSLIAGTKFLSAKAGQRYFGRKEFKGIRYVGEDAGRKFGGYEVVDTPQFRHDLRDFWVNLTNDLDQLPIGSVGETMAKGFTKGAKFSSLHDFTKTFINDSELVIANIKQDIEDNIRFLNRSLGDGEMADDLIKNLTNEQYNYFLNNVAEQVYGTLRTASEDLPLRFAQTLDEQTPVVRRFAPDGNPVRASQLDEYAGREGAPKLVAKGDEVFEVDPQFWTIDLANAIRRKSLDQTTDDVLQRKIRELPEDYTSKQVEQLRNQVDETIGTPVEVNGKTGYVVDFDDAGYTVRTADGDLKRTSVLSRLSDEQVEQQIREATNNRVVRQMLLTQPTGELPQTQRLLPAPDLSATERRLVRQMLLTQPTGELPQTQRLLPAHDLSATERQLVQAVDDIVGRMRDLQRRYEVLDDVVDDPTLRGNLRREITRELKQLEEQKKASQRELLRFLQDNPELQQGRVIGKYNATQLALKFNDEIADKYAKRLANIQDENLGFHGGNLRYKAEGFGSTAKGTDVPFTGYYFFSGFDQALGRGNRLTGVSEVQAVDFSNYNTYKPETSSEYHNMRLALKKVPAIGELSDFGDAIDNVVKKLREGEQYGWNDGTLARQISRRKYNLIETLRENGRRIEEGNYTRDNVIDTPATIILKELGYEGIDVRRTRVLEGDADPNSGSFGSVLFDLKTKPQIVFPPKKAIDELTVNKIATDTIEKYTKRLDETAKTLGKTVNKQLELPFC